MTSPTGERRLQFQQRALKAYDEYMALQARIDAIEEQALKDYPNIDLAEFQLRKSDLFVGYRRLCVLRNIKMDVANLNARMALL